MASLIGLLFAVQMTLDVLRVEVGLAPGLSLKNMLLYLVAAFIGVRMVLRHDSRFELRGVLVPWLLLIGYATVTWALASTVLGYQTYPAAENAMALKGSLADYFIFFLVCFYGLRTEAETKTALKAMLLIVSAANLLTLTDAFGITGFDIIEVRNDGRVQGALGESNQYAAFLAFFIPLLACFTWSERGMARALWAFCSLMAVMCMMITVSRGGYVGLGAAIVIGCWMFRRQIAVGKLAAWGAASMVMLLLLLFAIDADFRALVIERIVAGDMRADPGGISSGRTDTWSDALRAMMDHPVTLLTGYGWRAYFSMPFEGSPHNTYLYYWFNLGIPGLALFIAMLYALVRKARQTVRIEGQDRTRYWFVGLAIGTMGVAFSVFFVELYQGWIYVWGTAGILMRLALVRGGAQVTARSRSTRRSALPQPRYGWSAKPAAPRLQGVQR